MNELFEELKKRLLKLIKDQEPNLCATDLCRYLKKRYG